MFFFRMVRNYKRVSKQHSWTEEAMKLAINEIRNGTCGYKTASEKYNVPIGTLHRRVRTRKTASDASKQSLGRYKTVFTVDQERELANYILLMESKLFGLTMRDFRALAYEYAEKNRIGNNFNAETRLAGYDWVYGFLNRNQNVSLRLPENTSAARASAFNKPNVATFFKLLGELMDKYKFTASRIFNCDETGISTVPNKPSKILSLKGKKQVGVLSSAERGVLVTAEICFNAAGFHLPPLMICPRVRRNPLFEVGLPPDAIVEYHPSGWMQSNIFAPIWFTHFLKHTKPSPDDPVLLILDGHATHTKNLTLIQMARENNVHILVLPPHTSHRLQPADVSFMFPLNCFYEQEAKNWLRNHPGQVITVHDVGSIFGAAFQRAATAQNAISGFKNTGIWPYNPEIFPEEMFRAAETTDQDPENNNLTIVQQEREQKTPPPGLQYNSGSVQNKEEKAIISKAQNINRNEPSSPQPGCSFAHTQSSIEDVYYSPSEIIPFPKAQPKQRKQFKRGKTTILTTTPNLEELKAASSTPKIATKNVKRKLQPILSCKQKKSKAHDIESTTSESSIEEICDDSLSSGDDEGVIISSIEQLSTEKVTLENLNKNDYLLVGLQNKKGDTKKFVAQVEAIEGDDILVSYMREYRHMCNIYVFPDTRDESFIYLREVIGRLQTYEMLRHGKIRFS